ncbi:MAG TPA: thiamine phosphate synthase [Alloacidobacterium sp.]|nr:thiamine phosphate synthase [Alloacidobacterium sp.]
MLLYAITDRTLFATPDALVEQAALWAQGGVDFVQIREKDLASADLTTLAAKIVSAVRLTGSGARVLLNGSAEMAAASGCDGVHLTADMPSSAIAEARAVMSEAVADPVISFSCHTLSDIKVVRDHGASLSVFAPVFEKQSGTETIPGQGLDALAAACRIAGPMPVFALGGVTAGNARDCIRAGAAGVAAIRLFASGDWRTLQ